ncbi:MAG TPA: diguanylate cyclase [Gammaproteobacteria bacterium]|nr:diguanylate cyclase [Gammaproteobacteria bacterium]
MNITASQQVRTTVDEARLARNQRLRKQRVIIAFGTYAIFACAAVALAFIGDTLLPAWIVLLYTMTIAIANAAFWWLIATGRNLRFRDPSLTSAQLLAAFCFQLFYFLISRSVFAQDLAVLSFLLSLLFGGFRLGAKQIAGLATPAFMVFAAVMVAQHGLVGQTLVTGVARATIYTLLFVGITFFAGYLSNLRSHLSVRNQDLRKAMARIEELVIHDDLTGVFNRRHIHNLLRGEVARAERTGSAFTVCMLDVDHFKRINDTHGHPVGDEILRRVVRRIAEGLRQLDNVGRNDQDDTLGRFGGEEFLLVLPATGTDGAYACAERLREAVASTPVWTEAGELSVTISGGIAEYQVGEGVEGVLKRADEALYLAKERGRNRIEGMPSPVSNTATGRSPR